MPIGILVRSKGAPLSHHGRKNMGARTLFPEGLHSVSARVRCDGDDIPDHRSSRVFGPWGSRIPGVPFFWALPGSLWVTACPDGAVGGMIWPCVTPSSTATCWVSSHHGR